MDKSLDRAVVRQQICERIAQGESLRKICSTRGYPSHPRVCAWLIEDAEFADRYARARQEQADGFFDEIVEISDTEPDPQKARVRIDARKWVAGKMRPKVYGDRVELEHSGGLKIEEIRRVVVDPGQVSIGAQSAPALLPSTVGVDTVDV